MVFACEAMRVFSSGVFPDVPLDTDSGYWRGEIVFGGARRALSLFVDAQVRDDVLVQAAQALGGLVELRARGLVAIAACAEDDATIRRDFFLLHVEEAPKSLPGGLDATSSDAAFVGALELCGVAIHAASDGAELCLDFSYDRALTDEVLAVRFGLGGALLGVSHES